MARRVRVDSSEVTRLAVDLEGAPERLQRAAPKVLEVAANKIKKSMRADIKDGLSRSGTHLPHLPHKVNYDRISRTSYEIGIDKGGQGDLGNIAAYGTSKNAPIFDHTAALRRETPEIVRHLGDAAEDAVLGGPE